MHKRRMQEFPHPERNNYELSFQKLPDHHLQFYASLDAAKSIIMCHIEESGWNLQSSPKAIKQNGLQTKLWLNSVHEETLQAVDGKP